MVLFSNSNPWRSIEARSKLEVGASDYTLDVSNYFIALNLNGKEKGTETQFNRKNLQKMNAEKKKRLFTGAN